MNVSPPFQRHRQLGELTTFGIGGEARYLVEVRSKEELQAALRTCNQEGLSYFILGKGSNLLFNDKGFNGVVIVNRIDFCEHLNDGCFHVGAGYSFSLLGSQTARQGWSGLEFASGIPGSVGGAVFMNAGANGKETCETLLSVDYISQDGQYTILSKQDLKFGYRFSSFQQMQGAIAGATFQLQPLQKAREKQLEIIQYRKKTQPLQAKSAGCIFRNPSCGHAGALIEQSGLKGRSVGGAQVSEVHANFVINTGHATAQDVLELIRCIQQEVLTRTGVALECEVRCIPYEPGAS